MGFWTIFRSSKSKHADLHEAVKAGDFEAVEEWIAGGADPHALDGRGMSALQTAAARGHLEIARFLVKSGADVNLASEGAGTPLIGAAACLQPEVIKLLIVHGAYPNKRGLDGRFPLLCPYRPVVTAVDRQIKSIQLLVANGGTALMCAAGYGNREAVEELLRLGADPALRNDRHENAAMRASRRGHDDLAAMLRQHAA